MSPFTNNRGYLMIYFTVKNLKIQRKLTRVPTNTKLERQTNFIQKLIDHSEYLNLFKMTQGFIFIPFFFLNIFQRKSYHLHQI